MILKLDKFKAIASYTSKNPNHLSFKQDDVIVVLDRNDDQYWVSFKKRKTFQ